MPSFCRFHLYQRLDLLQYPLHPHHLPCLHHHHLPLQLLHLQPPLIHLLYPVPPLLNLLLQLLVYPLLQTLPLHLQWSLQSMAL